MYANTPERSECKLQGLVMSDYVSADVMDGIAPELGSKPMSQDLYMGYGDRPSRGWLRTPRQFVLIKARDAAIKPEAFELARAVVAEAEQLAAKQTLGNDRLMVRGVEIRSPDRATIHLDLICAAGSAKPYLGLRAIQERLERHTWRLGEGSVAIHCKAQVVATDSATMDTLDDRYYERVRLALTW